MLSNKKGRQRKQFESSQERPGKDSSSSWLEKNGQVDHRFELVLNKARALRVEVGILHQRLDVHKIKKDDRNHDFKDNRRLQLRINPNIN